MIFKKLNVGNRNMYDVLLIDNISDDVYKTVAILKNDRENDPEPYVVALGYDLDNGTWASGWYYSDIESAKKAFYTHTIGGYKND